MEPAARGQPREVAVLQISLSEARLAAGNVPSSGSYNRTPCRTRTCAVDLQAAPDNPVLAALQRLKGLYEQGVKELPVSTSIDFGKVWKAVVIRRRS